ncbi:MAG TPA: DUF2066 domain-containing protein [Steroidobacteraceae bacterium]|nr:DUF2066 domain-containing protein [Steroidobacteraceae bacterium]
MSYVLSRRHRAPRASALLALGFTAATSLALAARPVDVYEVSVHGSVGDPAFQDAMREVLVRATGRRDAASDPTFAPLIARAAHYVSTSRSLGNDVIQVSFDGSAVEQQIVAAGRSVWDSQRPFTIVVLSPPPTGAAADDARESLEQLAEERGLPETLVPMSVADATGTALTSDALLAGAQQLGGDAMLLGRADPAGVTWQWTLITGFSTTSWNGTLADGINGAADALSRVEGNALPLAEENALVAVSGVSTLADYAWIERVLQELPGVHRSGLEEADGTTARFDVLIRGGAPAIERALDHSPHLERTEAAGAALTYQFHP